MWLLRDMTDHGWMTTDLLLARMDCRVRGIDRISLLDDVWLMLLERIVLTSWDVYITTGATFLRKNVLTWLCTIEVAV